MPYLTTKVPSSTTSFVRANTKDVTVRGKMIVFDASKTTLYKQENTNVFRIGTEECFAMFLNMKRGGF